MLRTLTIRHFAIISNITIHFDEGMTILTGETGAGKSIIINALSLLLGKQASDDWIKSDADSAFIEVIFEITPECRSSELRPYLDDTETVLIAQRTLVRGKSSLQRLNGQAVPLKLMKHCLTPLVSIVGQHEHMSLSSPHQQRELVDAFSDDDFARCSAAYTQAFTRYQKTLEKKQALEEAAHTSDQRRQFLDFQIQDISQHQFIRGEDVDLGERKKKSKNHEAIQTGYHSLSVAIENFLDAGYSLKKCFDTLSKYEVPIDHWETFYDELLESISDHQFQISQKKQAIDTLDIQNIDDVESRLDTLFKYKQMYKQSTIDGVCSLLENLKKERLEMDTVSDQLVTLQKDCIEHKRMACECAHNLYKLRKLMAEKLSKDISEKMLKLNFHFAQCHVSVTYNEEVLTESGSDTIAILISTNAGEPLKPIQDIASGGELSRILLAIRSLSTQRHGLPTLIFDEVDTGISGLTGHTVGEYLSLISKQCQVVCITHLPQVARFGDAHLYLSKSMTSTHTKLTIQTLNQKQRDAELLRLMGGEDMVSTLTHSYESDAEPCN